SHGGAGGRPRRCAGLRDSHQCHRRCAEQVPRQAGKHGKITQTFVSALSTSNPPGTSVPRQRAAGQIPPKRTENPVMCGSCGSAPTIENRTERRLLSDTFAVVVI